jgi:hypothetical protein
MAEKTPKAARKAAPKRKSPNRVLRRGWKFCPYCGADRDKICDERPFCGECGARVL